MKWVEEGLWQNINELIKLLEALNKLEEKLIEIELELQTFIVSLSKTVNKKPPNVRPYMEKTIDNIRQVKTLVRKVICIAIKEYYKSKEEGEN